MVRAFMCIIHLVILILLPELLATIVLIFTFFAFYDIAVSTIKGIEINEDDTDFIHLDSTLRSLLPSVIEKTHWLQLLANFYSAVHH